MKCRVSPGQLLLLGKIIANLQVLFTHAVSAATRWQNSQVGGYFRCVYALKLYEFTMMVVSCVVVRCTSRWVASSLSLHRIPNEEKRQLWLFVINRKHWAPTNNVEFVDCISF